MPAVRPFALLLIMWPTPVSMPGEVRMQTAVFEHVTGLGKQSFSWTQDGQARHGRTWREVLPSLPHQLPGKPVPTVLQALREQGWKLTHRSSTHSNSVIVHSYYFQRPSGAAGQQDPNHRATR